MWSPPDPRHGASGAPRTRLTGDGSSGPVPRGSGGQGSPRRFLSLPTPGPDARPSVGFSPSLFQQMLQCFDPRSRAEKVPQPGCYLFLPVFRLAD